MIASVAELMHIDGLYNETIHRYECMSNPDEEIKANKVIVQG